MAESPALRWNPLRWPLPVRVLLGVIVGVALGVIFGRDAIGFGWTTANLAELGGLYIRLLTALATPLIFLAIVDAFVQTQITGRQGLKMLLICSVNIAAAFAIGLTILNVWEPGRAWSDLLTPERLAAAESGVAPGNLPEKLTEGQSISLLEMLDGYVPKSILQPFMENTVLTVAVLGILVGAAMRSLKGEENDEIAPALASFEQLMSACFQIVVRMLLWLIELAPIAICFVIAGLVGGVENRAQLIENVGIYFVAVMAALGVHALIYYPLTAWLVGGVPPRSYFGEGASAILTGFSINSSLATAPLTLKALARMGVSDSSARLSACVGTNFNNDGITLYEAMTALFVAQAAGMNLSLPQQISVLLVVLAGSMGIAGIPNSGLIILTLVLKAAKLPEEVIDVALPLIISVDFINARVRSAVNVMGDLQVAIVLDAGQPQRVKADGS